MKLQDVLDTIIKQMADGDSDWGMPWHGVKKQHINILSGKAYTGINRLILWSSSYRNNFASSYWGTFNQWRARKQPVEKGQKGTVLVRPVYPASRKPEEEPEYYRPFHVFNGDQVLNRNESHPDMFDEDNVLPCPSVEELVSATSANIRHGGNRACYIHSSDRIEIPRKQDFFATQHSSSSENYYSTLLHELIHWTGHQSRENRQPLTEDPQVSYAFEELIAELGAAFLCVEYGLETVPRKDHAQYLNSWLKILQDKPEHLVKAAGLAQKAANRLTGMHREEPESDDSLPDWFQPQPTQPDMWEYR